MKSIPVRRRTLAVLAAVGILSLAWLVQSMVHRGQEKATLMECSSYLRQMGIVAELYRQDRSGMLQKPTEDVSPTFQAHWATGHVTTSHQVQWFGLPTKLSAFSATDYVAVCTAHEGFVTVLYGDLSVKWVPASEFRAKRSE